MEVKTVERGWSENGPTYDEVRVLVIDAAAAPLAAVRDQALAVAELLERFDDIAAADAAVTALRKAGGDETGRAAVARRAFVLKRSRRLRR